MILSVEGSKVGVEGGEGGCRVEMLWRCYPGLLLLQRGVAKDEMGLYVCIWCHLDFSVC